MMLGDARPGGRSRAHHSFGFDPGGPAPSTGRPCGSGPRPPRDSSSGRALRCCLRPARFTLWVNLRDSQPTSNVTPPPPLAKTPRTSPNGLERITPLSPAGLLKLAVTVGGRRVGAFRAPARQVLERPLGHDLVLGALLQARALVGREVGKRDVRRLVVVGVTAQMGEQAAERGRGRAARPVSRPAKRSAMKSEQRRPDAALST